MAARFRPGARASGTELITSRENRWLKTFRAALRGKGPVGKEPLAVEGLKLVEEAVRSELEAEALLVSESGEQELARILQAASESNMGIVRERILRTTDKMFASVACTEAPQGVALLFRAPEWAFDNLLRGAATREGAYRGDAALVLVMAGVQDPGNVGTIVRSAHAFGATGVVATRGTADPWSPKALRASAGAALRVPLLRSIATSVLLAQLKVAGLKIVATASGAADAGSVPWSEPLALFVGNEGVGLPHEVLQAADATVAIPMREEVESLNAGVAASLLLYEAAKQRSAGAAGA